MIARSLVLNPSDSQRAVAFHDEIHRFLFSPNQGCNDSLLAQCWSHPVGHHLNIAAFEVKQIASRRQTGGSRQPFRPRPVRQLANVDGRIAATVLRLQIGVTHDTETIEVVTFDFFMETNLSFSDPWDISGIQFLPPCTSTNQTKICMGCLPCSTLSLVEGHLQTNHARSIGGREQRNGGSRGHRLDRSLHQAPHRKDDCVRRQADDIQLVDLVHPFSLQNGPQEDTTSISEVPRNESCG